MKSALINPNEPAYQQEWVLAPPGSKSKYQGKLVPIANSQRVAEVVAEGQEFPVAEPMYWKPCADEVVADQWYLDTTNDQFTPVPPPPPYPEAA